jgi:hypothetical protein
MQRSGTSKAVTITGTYSGAVQSGVTITLTGTATASTTTAGDGDIQLFRIIGRKLHGYSEQDRIYVFTGKFKPDCNVKQCNRTGFYGLSCDEHD